MSLTPLDPTRTDWRYVSASSTTYNRSTLEVEAKYSADDMLAVIQSPLYPMIGSTLPGDSSYVLRNRTLSQIGNLREDNGVRRQFLAKLTYERNTTTAGGAHGGDRDPWDLDAQNVRLSVDGEQVVFSRGWLKGKEIANVNAAGIPFEATTTSYYRRLSFEYCIKGNREPKLNLQPILNKSKVTVAGVTIERECGKLMPLSAEFIVEYNDRGNVEREYWRVQAEILVREQSDDDIKNANTKGSGKATPWAIDQLNVGTMAVFIKGGKPEQIYRYYNWNDGKVDASKKPEFGSASQAIAAKQKFLDSLPDDKKKNPPDFPITEVTDPLPLDADGKLYLNAIGHPNEYWHCLIYDCQADNWNGYDMPRERE